MMMDKPLCPYCGSWNGHKDGVEMVPGGLNVGPKAGSTYMYCPICNSTGPVIHSPVTQESKQEAMQAALRRFQPMQKPMTLEETKEVGEGWFEGYEAGTEYFTVGYCEISFYRSFFETYGLCDEVSRYVNAYADFDGDCNGVDLIQADYGKKWRMWRFKPSDEEWEAAKWEEGEANEDH